jgi:putative transposase
VNSTVPETVPAGVSGSKKALRQAESGTRVTEICRKLGVSEATFYRWKKRYGSLGVSELRELRQLKDEHGRLKGLVADLSLDKSILQETLRNNF